MSDDRYPRPVWRLAIDGREINSVRERLIDLTMTDNRGMEADQLDITLDDTDGLLDIPERGAEITLSLGWSNTGLIEKGTFTVDETEHDGPPDRLTIRARSADLREGLTTKKERSWHKTTVGKIVRTIAEENELEPAISPELEGEYIEHIDQTSESDANLLTRLGEMFDAVATVKSGRLLFFKIGRGVSIGGTAFEVVNITRKLGDKHRFSTADRDACDAVKAEYYDTRSAKKGEVIERKKPEGNQKVEHSGGNIKTLRHTYANRANAQRAAKSALEKSKRGVSTFSITLALGRPELFPELPASVQGWKPAIDSSEWLLSKVTHRLSGSGLITELELELKAVDSKGEELPR